MKHVMLLFVMTLLYSRLSADTTITNNTVGFTSYLPDKWICSQTNDSTAILNDSTLTYKSQIVIKKFRRNKIDYPTPADWTRAHFIAYLLVTRYSYDPFGAVLYYDSTSSCKQGEYWATEAFSEYYTLDTVLGAWDEFMRYTSVGDFGYSLYAIGDTADMKKNVGMYAAIINSIRLIAQSTTSNFPVTLSNNRIPGIKTKNAAGIYDLSGRRREMSAKMGSQIIIRRQENVISTQITFK